MFRPPDEPWYHELVRQLSMNLQNLATGTETGFARQREERLIEEDRVERERVRQDEHAVAERRILEARAYDDAIRAKAREEALTDEAARIYEQRAAEIRQTLAFVGPDSETYQRAIRLLRHLGGGPTLIGQEARDQALHGNFIVDGEQMNVNRLIADLGAEAQAFQRQQGWEDIVYSRQLEHLGDGTIPAEIRAETWNTVIAGNSFFSDEYKEAALTLLGVDDPEARRSVKLGNDLTASQITNVEATTALLRTQTLREQFQLKQDQRLAGITYKQAVAHLEATLEQTAMSRAQRDGWIFERWMNVGFVPSDADDAERLLAMLPYDSIEDMQRDGQRRWARVQRLEKLEEEVLRTQSDILGVSLNRERVGQLMDQLLYDREAALGMIRENMEMVGLAAAAAMSGDTATLALLRGLSTEEPYLDTLGLVDFDRLDELAGAVFDDILDMADFERQNRELLLSQARLGQFQDIENLLTNAQVRFIHSDYTPDENGRRPVDDDIEAFLGMIPEQTLRAMGMTREQVTRDLTSRVNQERQNFQRGEAAALLQVLSETIPESPQARESWHQAFMFQADQAGIPEDVATSIAAGLMDESKNSYAKAQMDLQVASANFALALASAREAHSRAALNELTLQELMEAEDAEGVILDRETFTALSNSVMAAMSAANSMVNSAYCRIEPGGLSGDVTFDKEKPDCVEAAESHAHWSQVHTDLLKAFADGSPFAYGSFVGGITTLPVHMMETADRIRGMDGVNTVAFGELQRLANPDLDPDAYNDLLGILLYHDDEVTAQDINEMVAIALGAAEGRAGIRAEEAAAAERMPNSLSDIGVGSIEWVRKPAQERVQDLESTREWNEFIDQIESGDFDIQAATMPRSATEVFTEMTGVTPELDQMARRFGFRMAPPEGADFALGGMPVDRQGFLWAIDQTIKSRIERRRAAEAGGGAPGGASPPWGALPAGLLTTSGEASPQLFDALIQQESNGNHRKPDGTLTRNSDSGALGITQIMPETALSANSEMEPLVPPEYRAELWQLLNRARATGSPQDYAAFDRRTQEALEQVSEQDFLRYGREYLNWLLRRFDGDVVKALAAYNAGFGNVEAAIRQDPANWIGLLKEETQDYVPEILARLGQ
jgi:hypothetical protein